MKCPKCDSDMEKVTIENLELDRCIACNGIWFDEFELADFNKIKGSELVDIGNSSIGRKQNENDLIKCPKCDSRMIRMVDAKQSHIWFEHCGSCFGHFFDAGELKDLKKNTVMDFIKSWFTPERKP